MQTQYTASGARPEIRIKKDAPVTLKLDNGTVVQRQFYTNGDYSDTAVFAADYPDAIHVDVYAERNKKAEKKTTKEV
jgi:hypothetical protein|tara:strand:- start:20454 stop:20684 length:231 start_codon:yes stop_codon:yes gene_type:complete